MATPQRLRVLAITRVGDRRSAQASLRLRDHSWAIALLQSRVNPGPATLRHHNASIGSLRGAGFSVQLTAHAFALIDSYIYGFAQSEATLPIHAPDSVADVASSMMQEFFDPSAYPHLLEFTTEHILRSDDDFGDEFGYGLDLILGGLTASLSTTRLPT